MKVIIDGYEDLVTPEENETLGEFLSEVEKWIKENKRIVLKIRLEGKILSGKEKENLFKKKVNEFKILELFTANSWEWAVNSLKEIEENLPEISINIKRVSTFIQRGNYKKAFSLLESCLNAWDWTGRTLEKIGKILALDYAQISFKKETLTEKIKEFLEPLKEANRALKNKDFLTLADILEYEITPRIKEEQEMIKQITRIIKQEMN